MSVICSIVQKAKERTPISLWRPQFQILFTANKDEKIKIALKPLNENQEFNDNKIVSAFDKIFKYKHTEDADARIHLSDFINAEI